MLLTDTDGLVRSRESVEAEILTLQDWFHQAEDLGGAVWCPSRRTRDAKRARLVALLVLLGEGQQASEAAAEALDSVLHREPQRTYPLNGEGRLMDYASHGSPLQPGDEEDKFVPAALVSPGPEAEAARQALLSVLSDPSLTPHTRHKEDGLDDLTGNFLYSLYLRQDDLLVGEVLDAPLHPFHSFCQWFFARAVLYGYRSVYQFSSLLEEAYPHLPKLDPSKMSAALYARRLLDMKNAAGLDALARAADPAMLPTIGALMESYMDFVNASRPPAATASKDLPEMHRPNVRRNGFGRYKRRVLAVYHRLPSAVKVAQAFDADVDKTRQWLKQEGVMSGYAPKPTAPAQPTRRPTTRRHRRRY